VVSASDPASSLNRARLALRAFRHDCSSLAGRAALLA
jgi:hypothetical protein